MSLPTRELGLNGPRVTSLGFGAMSLSVAYGLVGSDEERFKLLDRVYELGEKFWDTSDIYGDNERLIGKWFRRGGSDGDDEGDPDRQGKRRDDIFLATKFGFWFDNRQQVGGVRSDPEHVKVACAKSLRRMKTDYIDLYYCHRVDGTTPIEKTIEAMVELKEEGKIRYLGLCEVSAETLRRAHAVHPITALQIEYSPLFLDIENEQIGLLKTCRELGVAVVAYAPLGRGMLTGRYRSRDDLEDGDWRKLISPRFAEGNFESNLMFADQIGELAEEKGCTAAQLVLAWLMAQGEDIFPIPGTKNITYAEENLGALELTLTEEEIQAVRDIAENVEVAGDRYDQGMLSTLLTDTPSL
ncbi:hypothetical protein FQN54_009861 [Arachnomyces sp. PD_36]|nr:hypothetical protein FQN54_009861 [Arachnomyces sp. PD_36]